MRFSQKLYASCLLALTPVCLFAQDMDMAVMMKWGNATVVTYNIVGVYQAETPIALKDSFGQVADVSDRVIVDVDWNIQSNTIVGQARVQNFPSEVKNPRNLASNCPEPVIKGHFELVDVTQVASSELERIDLTGTRSYSDVDITDCLGSTERRSVRAGQEPVVVYLPMPSPVMLAMPPMPQSGQMAVTISPDRKTFVLKLDGWTWTYTPTLKS